MARVSIRETLIVIAVLLVAGLITVVLLARDGAPPIVWRADFGAPVTAGPALATGVVVAASEDGTVLALDAASGDERWRVALDLTPRGSIEVGATSLFVRTDEDVIVAMSAESGAERWRYIVPGGANAPLLAGDTLVVASRSGVIVALDADTGEPRWAADTGRTLRAAPSLTGNNRDIVATGDIGGRLTRVALATGNLLDEIHVAGGEVTGPLLQASAAVVVGTRSGVVLLDSEHRELWRLPVSQPTRLPMIEWDGVIYVDSSPDLLAIDATSGTLRWRYTSRALAVTFDVGDGLVIAGMHTGEVHGIDLATGERRWRFRTNDSIRAAPVIDEISHTAYFGSLDGWLYAIAIPVDKPTSVDGGESSLPAPGRED